MALQDVGGHLYYPTPLRHQLMENPNPGNSFLLDAAGEKYAVCFVVPKDGTITKLGHLLGTVTQAPANGLTISLQEIDLTTGDPNGTPLDSVTGVTTGVATGGFPIGTLPTGVSVQAGQHKAAVFEFTNFSASDSLNFYVLGSAGRVPFMHSTHIDHYTTSWAKSINSFPGLYVEYSDGSTAPIPGNFPLGSLTYTLTDFRTGSTPDEVALYIASLPFSCRCVGLWAMVNPSNGAAFDLILYDNSNAILGQFPTPFDEDIGTENGFAGVAVMFDPVVLSAGATYRACLKPTLDVALQITYAEVAAAAHLNMWPAGSGVQWSQRTNGGSWSQNTVRLPMIGLILDRL